MELHRSMVDESRDENKARRGVNLLCFHHVQAFVVHKLLNCLNGKLRKTSLASCRVVIRPDGLVPLRSVWLTFPSNLVSSFQSFLKPFFIPLFPRKCEAIVHDLYSFDQENRKRRSSKSVKNIILEREISNNYDPIHPKS